MKLMNQVNKSITGLIILTMALTQIVPTGWSEMPAGMEQEPAQAQGVPVVAVDNAAMQEAVSLGAVSSGETFLVNDSPLSLAEEMDEVQEELSIAGVESKNITATGALIEGQIENFDSETMVAVLKYRKKGSFRWKKLEISGDDFEEDGSFSVALENLKSDRGYKFKIIVKDSENGKRLHKSETQVFKTLQAAPDPDAVWIDEVKHQNVLITSAVIEGRIENFDSEEMTAVLKYRKKGGHWEMLEISSDDFEEDGSFSTSLEDLMPGQAYEYQVVVKASDRGTQLIKSEIQTFETTAIELLADSVGN